jgi:DNA-binding MarR family transcriptional regulator
MNDKILNKTFIFILFNLKDGDNVTTLSKKIKYTYTQISKSLKYLIKLKLISVEKIGRIKQIILTNKGRKLKIVIGLFYKYLGE